MPITRRLVLGSVLAAPAIRMARADQAVSYLFPAPSFLPAFAPHHLALKRGYYAAQGLTVNFQTGKGGADVAKQVAVGNGDLGGGAGETSMIVRANGLPVRGVALLGGKSLYQIVARKPAGVTSIAGLRGKKVGVIGYQDTGYYSLLGALATVGVKKTDLEIQAVGPAGVTQLMISGSLDAIVSVPEWSIVLETAGVPLDYLPLDAVFPAMAQAVLASDDIIQKRPQAVRGFITALLHAMHDFMDDPVSAAKDYVAAVPQQAGKEAEIATILRRYTTDVYATTPPTKLGQFDPKRLKIVQDRFMETGVIQTAVPVEELYTNAFVG